MMDYEERREFLTGMLEQILNDDDGVFQAIAEEMDDYEGALNDSRCYPTCELDEILGEKKPSEVVNMLNDSFNSNDDYFYFSIDEDEGTNTFSGEVPSVLEKLFKEFQKETDLERA